MINSYMKVEEASYLFKVLSDQGRLNIVKTLYQFKELCANDLLMAVNCKQATLSHHMSVLVESGLVDSYKDGNKVYYSVNKKRINSLISFLNEKAKLVKENEKVKEEPVVQEVLKEATKKVEPKEEKQVQEQESRRPANNSVPTFLL